MQTDYGSSSLSQRVVAEWINEGFYEEHVAKRKNAPEKRRQIMIRALNKYCADIASWDIPSGGVFIWLKVVHNIPMKKKLFLEALSKGILLNPGRIYEEESISTFVYHMDMLLQNK